MKCVVTAPQLEGRTATCKITDTEVTEKRATVGPDIHTQETQEEKTRWKKKLGANTEKLI